MRKSAGLPKAWAVAAASPWSKSTQPATAPKASTTGTTSNGVNRTANGAVSRRVTAGSVTTPAEPERQQRVGPAQLGLAPVGPPEQAERPQRRVDQLLDVRRR